MASSSSGAWPDLSVDDGAMEEPNDTTPLNSPEKRPSPPGGGGGRSRGRSFSPSRARERDLSPAAASSLPVMRNGRLMSADERRAAEQAQHALDNRSGADLRRANSALAVLGLLLFAPLVDLFILTDVLAAIDWTGATVFGGSTKSIARVAQLLAVVLTLALGFYSVSTFRRWQISLPRHAAAAAAQFALLPEHTTIALVLDVGKLAYPQGSRVPAVAFLMLLRMCAIVLLLRIAYLAGVRKGLVAHRQMPEMLRTLVSLEGVESKGLSDVAHTERPLSVALLEKLIVFLTPKRLGERPKEGAGLARNSALPLTIFVFMLTAAAATTEYERLRSSQEPLFEPSVAQELRDKSNNQTDEFGWTAPSQASVPPVSAFLVIVSGANQIVGEKILASPFDVNINPLCGLDMKTWCESHTLRSVVPSTSLPNWIAALTGASPTVHGVLGNFGLGPFPYDSVFSQAARYGVHAGVSATPWLVNPIKPDLPLLDGDARVTSSADGVYETTQFADTGAADARRRTATTAAVTANAANVANDQRDTKYPQKYSLFVSQFTNVDSNGHRKGAETLEYEDAMREAAEYIKDLMGIMPFNSVLMVISDHGNEALGGNGGTSEAASKTTMYTYRKSVEASGSDQEIALLAAAASKTMANSWAYPDGGGGDSGSTSTAGSSSTGTGTGPGTTTSSTMAVGGPAVHMLDIAPTLSLILGLPIPRHAEGGFMPSMFRNARREMWPNHARDLMYQRYHYAKTLIDYEGLDLDGRLRALSDLELDVQSAISQSDGSAVQQAVAWLERAGEVQGAINDARMTLETRYSSRNLAVSFLLGAFLVTLVGYILHVMTFADPLFVWQYRKYDTKWKGRHRFWEMPDVIAMVWAASVVGAYYFLTITVYLAILQGSWKYSAFDSSHVHDTFSQRRFLFAALFPGLFCQWALMRTFTIFYRKPFKEPTQPASLLLVLLRYMVKMRLFLSAQAESYAVAKVYLIRLYVAAFSILATVLVFVCSSSASFPLPYMYQPKHIDSASWDARFQTLTYKIMSIPLLLGAMYNLYLWGGTKLTVDEVDALYALKRKKEARLLGVLDEEEEEADRQRRAGNAGALTKYDSATAMSGRDGGEGGSFLAGPAAAASAMREAAEAQEAADEEAMLKRLVRRKQHGELTVDGLQEVEQLLLRTKAQGTLAEEKLGEMRRRIDRQMHERSEAIQAVRSSKAFLGRGFRDIEMLLEAGFRELEDQRSSFMANRRKKLRQKIERDRARRAQRTAGVLGVGTKGKKAGQAADDGSAGATATGGGGAEVGEGGADGLDSESESDSGESLASFDSDQLASMDFDELQARLAANEAKERRSADAQYLTSVEKESREQEAEAADVRRTEYASLAQSKMGKQAQLDELTSRVEKEQASAASVRERLEAALADEQMALQEWETIDSELQEAELERATVVAQKTKAKELALEKAQVAESSLEELKDKYRELRRKEEKVLRAVRDAQKEGEEQSKTLEMQADSLRHQRQMWLDKIGAAEADRTMLFGEAQVVEKAMREQKVRKAEAQASAAHYRDLLKTQM